MNPPTIKLPKQAASYSISRIFADYDPRLHLIRIYPQGRRFPVFTQRAFLAHELTHAWRFISCSSTPRRYCRSKLSWHLEEAIADLTALHLTSTITHIDLHPSRHINLTWALSSPRKRLYIHTAVHGAIINLKRIGWVEQIWRFPL